MKIIAFYLPQFHTFPENDQWWGKGFTEWNNVKKAKSIFEGHNQPKIPSNNNYYNLLENDVIKWQVDLAKKYGIYGFCYYHYWFDGKLLMEKPMEHMLEDKSIDFPFCISWANENWTRAWAQKNHEVLISQTYGGKEEWRAHFNYLLPFFKDNRYIKVDGKPVMIIYRPEIIPVLEEMLIEWKNLAKENGFEDLCIIYQRASTYNHLNSNAGYLFDYGIEYQPDMVHAEQKKTFAMLKRKVLNVLSSKFHCQLNEKNMIAYNYDDTWNRILTVKPRDEKMIPGAFINWDNTPRHNENGSLELGYTVEKFHKYLSAQMKRAKEVYHKDMIFLFAWNEWGEGGYLEPDEDEKFSRLEAVKGALRNNEELIKDEDYVITFNGEVEE